MFTFARHAAVDALIVYGALWAVLTAVFLAFLVREVRRVRKQAQAERRRQFDADLEAILRDAAGDAL